MSRKIIMILLVLCLCVGSLAVTASAESAYCINGVTVRYDDFTSRPGACRVYAGKLYQKIWGTDFSSDFYDDDNMLRNLEDEDLTLTEEHLKEYISQAELGSAFRVSSLRYLHRNDGGAGHTQLIVQKDDEGFTVLEGGLSEYPYYREYYYTWSEFVNTHWLGGRYGYIKYIKWPGAPEYDENYDTAAPQVADAKVAVAPDYSGFSVTFTATDDVQVQGSYIRVWPQGLTEEEGFTTTCTWNGDGASASVVFDSFENGARNFYVKCCAVDGRENIGDTEPLLVCLYPPDVEFRGYCQVVADDAAVRNAPVEEINGEDTRVYAIESGSLLDVCGLCRDAHGVRWYRLSDGLWVRERDVRYNTFMSFLSWALEDRDLENITWHDGQILFMSE